MGVAIGIDFGTTNSLCAWLDGDRPSVIPNRRGSRTTPSVVAATEKGEILVGESARNQALLNPELTLTGLKRLLGSGSLLALGGGSYRAEELAALILASLKRDAERHIGKAVDRAVITAPAHFSERERRALVEAGELAGLEVLRIINEPTAAAVARAWAALPAASPKPSIVLVYDFGGGTFDVTLLRQEGRDCAVLASRGDARLGGTDLDAELRRLASASFRATHGLDAESDRFLSQQLTDAAERAKIELSERMEASISLPFAAIDSGSGARIVHPSLKVTRKAFEELALPFVRRSLELTERALADAGIESSSVDTLVLSGGSSRMPLVRALLAERLGLEPEGAINPEEIVALGAAAWTSLVEGSERFSVRDVVSRTYGVEIEGGRFLPVIPKNSPVPSSRGRVFTTVAEGQLSVEIHVLQGESRLAAENLSLGRFLLSGIRSARKGEPQVRVEFSIDESGLLHVSARDLDTGAAQAISIADLDRGASPESREELARKAGLLARRIGELRLGLELERGIGAELDELSARARRAVGASSEGRCPPEGELRMLKAELEGLVGELLARKAEEAGR